MSTRWYPIYQRGNPQLRVFLPDFWLKLVKPDMKQPPNVVQFHCSLQMTIHDIKNYLEKIYKIPVADVRTRIALGKTKRHSVVQYVVKEEDTKIAYVTLPKGQTFVYPELFAGTTKEDESINEFKQAKMEYKKYLETNSTPGYLGWFRV